MKKAIQWFRRDLRVSDNTAFNEATRRSEIVFPLFILDEDILSAPDMGAARIAYLLDCLRDLSRNLKALGYSLTIRRGRALEELGRFISESKAEAVFANRDYEPHCQQRDRRVEHSLNGMGVGFELFKDAVIWEDQEVLTRLGKPYTVFTPYAKAWRAKKFIAPSASRPRARTSPNSFNSAPIPANSGELGYALRQNILAGGESQGLKTLDHFLKNGLSRYGEQRDFPALDITSHLSPHLHFGTTSIRTVLDGANQALKSANMIAKKNIDVFIQELIWRDFYVQIMENFPHVLQGSFRPEYDALSWSNDKDHFQAWCAGQTGYPLVDAAMRCLNATGWMHNRLRMVVSMFLTKDLLLPWQWGERYFMQMLVDGDHAANNGGWQWSAGTGTDAAPYFRIFNPFAQGERFDPDGTFIRRWVPELNRLENQDIHHPWEQPALAKPYPSPIVQHAAQREKCLAMYQKIRRSSAPTS